MNAFVWLCAVSCRERNPSRYRARQQVQIAIQIEPAFKIQESGHLSLAIYALDVRSGQREFQDFLILLDLIQAPIQQRGTYSSPRTGRDSKVRVYRRKRTWHPIPRLRSN